MGRNDYYYFYFFTGITADSNVVVFDRYITEWVAVFLCFFFFTDISPSGSPCFLFFVLFFTDISPSGSPCFLFCFFLPIYH